MNYKQIAKKGTISGILVSIGNLLPENISEKIAIAGNRIELGSWYRKFGKVKKFKNRFELIKYGLDLLDEHSIYLEFGVAWGNLMEFVIANSKNIHEFHGFDSFQGLPEPHTNKIKEKSFNLYGEIPNFNNPKVKIHKGLFSETLNGNEPFLTPKKFIVLDCDLFSSTNEVLCKIRMTLHNGDFLYFDDLHIPNQERLALDKVIGEGLSLEIIGRSREGRSALFCVKQSSHKIKF